MTDGIQSLLLSEMYLPNRRLVISGEHYFTDKDLYTNLYGVSFFGSFPRAEHNPYISPIYSAMPGILDEFLGDGFINFPQRPAPLGEMQRNIMLCMDKKFTSVPKRDSKFSATSLACSCHAAVNTDGNSVIIQYGSVLPNTLCITEGRSITAQLPFSPFTNVTFYKNKRTLQTIEYPIAREPNYPSEDILIDFSVTVKKMECLFDSDLCGKIDMEYSLDVGTSKCESAKVLFEISYLPPDESEQE